MVLSILFSLANGKETHEYACAVNFYLFREV